ncbi:hypothetical protein [Duganella vulcania]|uniref:Uncharacterized protein n=1 Tax=Duganella vulcania TaxID=2692166 RepID=A0A845GFQ5_9BURK|nr:hypothetical protein [Duganella vulcania]MYM92781.1 hypothetical protein [Duganella vulcania]
MSQHDCRLSGIINTNEATTIEMIHSAMAPFLQVKHVDFEQAMNEGSIEFDGGSLSLNIDFACAGSEYRDAELDTLFAKLSAMVDGPNWLEVFDYDTGNIEDARVPHFLGSTDERKLAQLQYALVEFGQWAEPVIGKDAVMAVEAMVLAKPRN